MSGGGLWERIDSTREDWLWEEFDRDLLAKLREKTLAKLREIDFPFEETDKIEYQWDGAKLQIKPPPRKWIAACSSHPSCILHDVAHWAVCPSGTRRSSPEFGLGTSPDGREVLPDPGLSYDNKYKEEEKASLLGVLLEYDLGMPAGDGLAVHRTLTDDESFGISGTVNFEGLDGTLNWLIGKGLISADYNVNWARVREGVARF